VVPGDEIVPDAISWAKAIGSGYPLGAFWVRDRAISSPSSKAANLAALLGPGTHGTTYGGSPLACAVGLATLGALLGENLCANARETGAFIRREVERWRSPVLKEFRQLGLFIGFELDGARLQSLPALQSGKTPSIHAARLLLDAGLMTVPAGPDVVRWLPPLNITRDEAAEALRIMHGVLGSLAA
jgi:acetylornithine/succinyldiaminopimelate/putrescine aminotransferase